MEEKEKLPRSKTFVDSRQQFKFCVELVLHALILPLLLMISFSVEPISNWVVRGGSEDSQQVVVDFIMLCADNWWVFSVVVVITAVISVLFSNKIFGPMYRYRQSLEALMRGEGQELFKVRKGDYFQDFAMTLEKYVNERQSKD